MLKLNVGFNRKAGEANYGSRGASVNLELELSSELATDSERLRERIRSLFLLAKASVDEELHGNSSANGQANGNGRSNGASNGNGNGRRKDATRPATASQVRALHAIAQRLHLDATNIVQSRYGVDTPEDLSITEASALIDELKKQASSNGGEAGDDYRRPPTHA